jgi:hypothetical protein
VVNVDIRDKKIIYHIGNVILLLIKYFCLILFILTAGKTLGLTVFSLVKGDTMPNTLIATMINHITGNDIQEVLESIIRFGKLDTIVSAAGIGFADSITYILLFFVLGGYSKLYKSLILDNIYTIENLEILKESVPLTMILLFTQPIIITIIRDLIKINNNFGGYNFIGIPFVIISVLLYLVVDKGLLLEKKIKLYERKLAKAEEEKQEAEIIALEKKVREHHDKKTKKVVEKKTVTKKEEPKKEEPKKNVKKVATTKKKVAKTTTKKSSK